jgi:cell division transport system permease protein
MRSEVDILMRLRNWRFFIRQGFQNIRRNWVMSLASIVAILVALFVLSLVLIVAMNLESMVQGIESKMEVTIYLKDDISYQERCNTETKIKSWEGVYDVVFVSKQEALAKWKQELGDKGSLLDGYAGENNPLPDSFILKIEKPEYVEGVVEEARALPAVESVNYSSQVTEFIGWITKGVRFIGTAIVIILAVVAVIIISNTIRLTVYSRRREINIMKYIGATDWFIRWPFIIEGFIIGIVGALASTALVAGVYKFFMDKSGYLSMRWGYLGIINFLPWDIMICYALEVSLLVGACVGVISSCISIGKHLKV